MCDPLISRRGKKIKEEEEPRNPVGNDHNQTLEVYNRIKKSRLQQRGRCRRDNLAEERDGIRSALVVERHEDICGPRHIGHPPSVAEGGRNDEV